MTGKIKRIGEIEIISNNFCIRKLILEFKEKGTTAVQTVEFDLKNGHVESVDGFFIGDMVKVYFNIRGREYIKEDKPVKVFNSLDIFRIEPVEDPTKKRTVSNYVENKNVELPF
ncbi:MAG: DUF3127 domain-containing protein [bacterium]|nr:DUF3127 domain-containing protein [bacterium]